MLPYDNVSLCSHKRQHISSHAYKHTNNSAPDSTKFGLQQSIYIIDTCVQFGRRLQCHHNLYFFVIRCFLAAEPHVSLFDSEVLLKLQIAKQVSTQSRAADLSTHIPLYRRLDTHRLITFRPAVSQVPTTQSLVSQCIVHVLRSTDNFGICNGKE